MKGEKEENPNCSGGIKVGGRKHSQVEQLEKKEVNKEVISIGSQAVLFFFALAFLLDLLPR